MGNRVVDVLSAMPVVEDVALADESAFEGGLPRESQRAGFVADFANSEKGVAYKPYLEAAIKGVYEGEASGVARSGLWPVLPQDRYASRFSEGNFTLAQEDYKSVLMEMSIYQDSNMLRPNSTIESAAEEPDRYVVNSIDGVRQPKLESNVSPEDADAVLAEANGEYGYNAPLDCGELDVDSGGGFVQAILNEGATVSGRYVGSDDIFSAFSIMGKVAFETELVKEILNATKEGEVPKFTKEAFEDFSSNAEAEFALLFDECKDDVGCRERVSDLSNVAKCLIRNGYDEEDVQTDSLGSVGQEGSGYDNIKGWNNG